MPPKQFKNTLERINNWPDPTNVGYGKTVISNNRSGDYRWSQTTEDADGDVSVVGDISAQNAILYDLTASLPVFSDANKKLESKTASDAFSAIKQAATADATGVVELATDAEAIAGTDTARAVTSANLTARFGWKTVVTEAQLIAAKDFTGVVFVNAAITLTANLTTTCGLYINRGCPITATGYVLTENGPHLSVGSYQQYIAVAGEVVYGASVNVEPLPVWWGADTTGATDATAAWLAAGQSLGTNGGVVRFKGAYLLDDDFTMPSNVFYVGYDINPGQRKDASYVPANYSSYVIFNPAKVITHQHKCGIKQAVIINKDISPLGAYGPLPFADATEAAAAVAAFAGTLFKPVVLASGAGAVCDFRIEDLLILGFEYLYDAAAVGVGGLNRPYFRNIRFDCTNGIHVYKVYDIGRAENCHAWEFTTTNQAWTSDALLTRTGTAFYTGAGATWFKWDDCFEYGWAVGHDVVGVQQVRQINCGADGPATNNNCIGFQYSGAIATISNTNPLVTAQGNTGILINTTAQNNVQDVRIIGGNFDGNISTNGYINVQAGNYSVIGSSFGNNSAVGHIKLDAGAGDGTVIGTVHTNIGVRQPVVGDATAITRCKLLAPIYDGTYVKQAILSWTPALQFGGAAVDMTYGTQVGRYQLDGNVVTCSFTIILTEKGSSTGSATIAGLPLTSKGGIGAAGGNTVPYNLNMDSIAGAILIQVKSNNTVLNVWQQGATGIAALTDANFTDTSAFYGTFQYLID